MNPFTILINFHIIFDHLLNTWSDRKGHSRDDLWSERLNCCIKMGGSWKVEWKAPSAPLQMGNSNHHIIIHQSLNIQNHKINPKKRKKSSLQFPKKGAKEKKKYYEMFSKSLKIHVCPFSHCNLDNPHKFGFPKISIS